MLDFIDPRRYTILPNTAGCFTAEDAIRVARLGRELLAHIGNPRGRLGQAGSARRHENPAARPGGHARSHREARERRLPGPGLLLATTRCSARRLKAAGAASVMPAGSPIGCGQGMLNPNNIRIMPGVSQRGDPDYPVIVDAGVGTASDVTAAMELGVDALLLNTGIASAKDPLADGPAMGHATLAGFFAARAGRIPANSTRPPARLGMGGSTGKAAVTGCAGRGGGGGSRPKKAQDRRRMVGPCAGLRSQGRRALRKVGVALSSGRR